LAPLASFVLPGGALGAAQVHVARTIVRRAERTLVHLAEAPGEKLNRLVLAYINRLSDLLFVLARVANAEGAGDVLWEPGRDATA